MSVRGRFLSVLVSVVTALAGFVAVGALPAAAAPGIVQYVALGDSYAAGTAAGSFPDDCEQTPLTAIRRGCSTLEVASVCRPMSHVAARQLPRWPRLS
jgi:hypothetical protein